MKFTSDIPRHVSREQLDRLIEIIRGITGSKAPVEIKFCVSTEDRELSNAISFMTGLVSRNRKAVSPGDGKRQKATYRFVETNEVVTARSLRFRMHPGAEVFPPNTVVENQK